MIRKLLSTARHLAGLHDRSWRRRASDGGAVVLMYHRVDPPSTRPDLHVPSLYGVERGVAVDVFERQMRFMLKHFEPREITDLWPEGARRPGFAVTFDDGYADNLTLAAPVLERLAVPGIVFLSTDYIGTDRRFWWETLGAMFRETTRTALDRSGLAGALEVADFDSETLPLGTAAERERAHWLVSEALMRTPEESIHGSLVGIAEALGVTPRFENRDWPLLTWDQVVELPEHGIEIGAHGSGHANLGLAGSDLARRQVLDSIEAVTAHTDRPVRAFAYPYGGPEHRSPAAVAAVRDAGCVVALTTELGVATPMHDILALPRAGLTRGDALACAYQVDEAFRSEPTPSDG